MTNAAQTRKPTTPIQPQTGVNAAPQQAQPKPAATVFPTVDIVKKVCPDSDINNIKKNLPYILKAMAEGGLTSKNDLIAVICTIYVEVTAFAPIEEIGKGGGRHGNYFGRGFVQLTWKENYEACGKALKMDLVGNPKLALSPEVAAKALVWFFKTNKIPAYAAKGDFDNVRSIVNAGSPGKIGYCWGVPVYRAAVERAKQHFTQGIDPNAVGGIPLAGDYGVGCADPGAAGGRSLAGQQNPNTQADALAYALGLHEGDRQRSHGFEATLQVASNMDILKLDAQKTFELKGVGVDLDGTFTVDEVLFYPLDPRGLIATIHAYKPDPNAPKVQVFLHDANAGLTPPDPLKPTPPVTAGAIPQKIYQAAIAAKGKSTASGPGGGNVACAWATNNFCVVPAGLKKIGSNPDYVPSMVQALNGGRGRKVPRAQAVSGDIWISPNEGHVGVCVTAGCTRVLSNSSSRASFAWEDAIDSVNRNYGGGSEQIYRVLS